MTKTGELGQYGEINHAISLGEAATDINDKASLILEVFEYSAKDGLEVNKVSVPLIFSKPFTSTTKVSGGPTTTMNGVEETVKIYFNNNKLDPEISCNKVFPVERKLIINDDFDRTVRLVLEQLLFGPNQTEITDSYSTSLPVNVKINKTNLVDGELTVDFDNQLQAGIGGSCRVSAIRTQITKTLMDLPGVDSVIISIDGNIKDILQP
jgi:spore germination protein GerM